MNDREAGNLSDYRAHYDVTAMLSDQFCLRTSYSLAYALLVGVKQHFYGGQSIVFVRYMANKPIEC